ncbi:MAG TPA: DUF1801 domain-containing protein [Chitinophagaceae bacterium]
MKDSDIFFLQNKEPAKSCLLYLRDYILAYDKDITEAWRYGMPFYCYKGKRFCYLWIQKKTGIPYLGVVEGKKVDHPLLIAEKRSRMKIMLVDPVKDVPVKTIAAILKRAIGAVATTHY